MKNILKRVYLSPLGFCISLIQNWISIFHRPFMVYGFYNRVEKRFMKHTRVASNVKIVAKNKLNIQDNIWIGYYSFIDATYGVTLEEGIQTGSHVCIYSHSSHISIRLLGKKYLSTNSRIAFIKKPVKIGKYSFIGTLSVIFPGVTIGKGSLIKANSVVTKSFPDYAIIAGTPARQVGSTLTIDKKYFKKEDLE